MEDKLQNSLLSEIRDMQRELRDRILARRNQGDRESLASPVAEAEDTIYHIDRITEEELVELVEQFLGHHSLTLVAEGIGELRIGKGPGPPLRIIVDPIDGTRPLMHDKRSGWILAGVAPDHGQATNLSHILLAVMTEIPVTKQWRADQLWAMAGCGAQGEGEDILRGGWTRLHLMPSQADDLLHGYAQVARFFPGVKAELASLEEEVFRRVQPETSLGRGHIFEDQYASTAGQLYEMMMGRDRFIADLRPMFKQRAMAAGLPRLICCHPYDVCTALIARECGVIVEQPDGSPMAAPLDVETDVAWVAYANQRIKALVSPVLREVL